MSTITTPTITTSTPTPPGPAPCSASELAGRIANEILTVGASGGPIRCTRAVLIKGRYPDDERSMGGRNHASIAMVIREHLLAAGFSPNAELSPLAVARFLRAEACRDVPDNYRQDLTQFMRVLADYFSRREGHHGNS